MLNALENTTENSNASVAGSHSADTVLDELWAVKSAMNEEANFELNALVRNAHAVSQKITPNSMRIVIG